MSKLIEKQLNSTSVFDGVLLHVKKDEIELPNGRKSVREYIKHPGAVCVIPIDGDGNVIIERQYRYPVGEILIEIPAGKLNSREEDPEDACRRELREETGYVAGKLTYLGFFYPSPAYTDERIYMYMAEELSLGERELDDDEFIDVERIPFETLYGEVIAGNIRDIKTQACVLRAKELLKE